MSQTSDISAVIKDVQRRIQIWNCQNVARITMQDTDALLRSLMQQMDAAVDALNRNKPTDPGLQNFRKELLIRLSAVQFGQARMIQSLRSWMASQNAAQIPQCAPRKIPRKIE